MGRTCNEWWRGPLVIGFILSPLLCAIGRGDDVPLPPAPVAVAIVAPKEVTGTGKRSDPFVFTAETRCILKLVGAKEKADWDTDDAPADIEKLDTALVFSLLSPGSYQVINKGGPDYCRCWFVIKSGTDPPAPEDAITRRVKAALAGHAEDAVKFGSVCDELAKAMDAGKILKQSNFEASMEAGLNAVDWPKGKYAGLTALSSELFDRGDTDWTLTADDKAAFAKSLRAISAACKGVK